MTHNFEYLDLILLIMIAVFILFKLRGMLGRRDGYEEKSFSKFTGQNIDQKKESKKEISGINEEQEFTEDIKYHFLKGAREAYETIITSFAKGDKSILKPLLGKKMFQEFSQAIDERNVKKLKSETTFIGVKSVNIKKFAKLDNTYSITVDFVSEIITCLKDKDDKIIEGNPDRIKTVNDSWKFSKNMWSRDPTWYLVETPNEI